MMPGRAMAAVPRHPDANWWAYMRRGDGICSGPQRSLIVFRADDISRLLRDGAIDKAVPRALASEHFSSGALGLLASCSLTWANDAEHRRLRGAIDGYWAAGRRQTLEAACSGRVAQVAIESDPLMLPEAVVRVVTAQLVSADERSDLVTELLSLAARLSALQYNPNPLGIDDLDEMVSRMLETLRSRTPDSGSLAEHLFARTELSVDDACGLLLFVVSATVETLWAVTQMCLLARTTPERVSIESLLKWATPAPFAMYGTRRRVTFGRSTVNPGTPLIVAFGSASDDSPHRSFAFGFGSHYCYGARLATLIGRVLLDTLPERGLGVEAAWDRHRFIRRLW
jgi:cytochrome P450